MNLAKLLKQVEKLVVDNSPSICTAIGVIGVVTTAYFTGKATVKATRILDNERYDDAPVLEKVLLVWPEYIPAVVSGSVAIGCIIGANKIGSRRAAAVAAAYSISEKAFAEYKDKVVEKIGDKKEQKIRDEVAQARVDRKPVEEDDLVITSGGSVLCCDSMSGRYFKSSVDALRRAQAELNLRIMTDNYASLSDFYDLIGLDSTSISSEVGWNLERMLELMFSTTMAANDKPCIYVNYSTEPIRGYYRLR